NVMRGGAAVWLAECIGVRHGGRGTARGKGKILGPAGGLVANCLARLNVADFVVERVQLFFERRGEQNPPGQSTNFGHRGDSTSCRAKLAAVGDSLHEWPNAILGKQ